MRRAHLLLFSLACLTGCAGPAPYQYRYIPGRTAFLREGKAIAPPSAPPEVQAAVAAGNEIAGAPYRRGGGHGPVPNPQSGFDCSGAASHVLRAAGLLRGSMPSKGFRRFGERGEGEWISIYARRDHVFLVIAGLRFDTGWKPGPDGPGWTTASRPTRGSVVRHPNGL